MTINYLGIARRALAKKKETPVLYPGSWHQDRQAKATLPASGGYPAGSKEAHAPRPALTVRNATRIHCAESAKSAESPAGADPRPDLAWDSFVWGRVLQRAHAIESPLSTGLYRALYATRQRGARLIAGEGVLRLVSPPGDESRVVPYEPFLPALLRATLREPAVIHAILTGAMPPLRAVCRPERPCPCCHTLRWRQRPDGGWVCGTCHPDAPPAALVAHAA